MRALYAQGGFNMFSRSKECLVRVSENTRINWGVASRDLVSISMPYCGSGIRDAFRS